MKDTPFGVKLISILYYIAAIILILIVLSGPFIFNVVSQVLPVSDVFISIIVLDIFALGFATLNFFIGRGLWKGKNWARIAAIVLHSIGLLSIFSGTFSAVLQAIFHIIIISYLSLSKKVKIFFRK